MLPRWHILLGVIFTFVIWFFAPYTRWEYLALVFLASFLIDFDHYINAVIKSKKLSLFQAFHYHRKLQEKEIQEYKKGIRNKGDFHLFHTIEFQFVIGVIGIFWAPFFYIFIGMIFHSLIDLCYSLYKDRLYRRNYFLFDWIRHI